MTYQETLNFLYSQLPMYQRTGGKAYHPGLEVTKALDAYLGHPHLRFVTIHIAGTNGKGSVAHMLASVLQEAGYRTGLYTSPHLSDYRERIRVNGEPVPKEEVIGFVQENRKKINELKPSFFEMSVGLAFHYFAQCGVDVAVVETGMGGRLDSTNIVTPRLSIITNISFDHTAFLGNSLQAIAGEKAGIIKHKTPVIIGSTQPETQPVFDARAQDVEAPVYYADALYKAPYSTYNLQQQQVLRVEGHPDITELVTDLQGAHQKRNIPAVLQAREILQKQGIMLPLHALKEGLKQVAPNTGIKGRWQYLGYNPRIIADIGHNPEGLQMNMQFLNDIPHKQLHMVFGTVNDKNPHTVLDILPRQAQYYFTQARVPRAFDAQELFRHAQGKGLAGQVISNVGDALQAARKQAKPEDLIFVGGSTFVVAEVV